MHKVYWACSMEEATPRKTRTPEHALEWRARAGPVYSTSAADFVCYHLGGMSGSGRASATRIRITCSFGLGDGGGVERTEGRAGLGRGHAKSRSASSLAVMGE